MATDGLPSVLAEVGLEHLARRLAALGVDAPGDLDYLQDWELQRAGLRPVEVRKLRASAAGWAARQRLASMERQAVTDALNEIMRCSWWPPAACAANRAREHLSAAGAEPRDAVSALAVVGEAHAAAGGLDGLVKLVRDVVTFRVQLRVPLEDRAAFLEELSRANGSQLSEQEVALYMHSHRRRIGVAFPDRAFASKSREKWGARADRPPPRARRNKGARRAPAGDEPEAEYEGFDDHAGAPPAAACWPRRARPAHPAAAEEEDDERAAAAAAAAGDARAPGLEIAEVGSEASAGTWATGGKRHARRAENAQRASGAIVHPSGARTQASAMSEPGAVPDMNHTDFDGAEDARRARPSCGGQILVLAEPDHLLVCKSWPGQWTSPNVEVVPYRNGLQLHIPRQALTVVAELVQSFSFAVVSNMGHWHCLPVTRILLERAFPDHRWAVEETFEGEWTSYSEGINYTIDGGTLRWLTTDREDIECGGHSSAPLHFEGEWCSVEMQRGYRTWGRLTPDGLLEWHEGEQVARVWTRAGRSAPPCLVCRDLNLRVYVFDRESVAERMRDTDDGAGWVWYNKELFRVWSALQEADFGAFGPWNTVHLDQLARLSSHPENVFPVTWDEEGGSLDRLGAFLRRLAAERPGDTAAFLRRAVPSAGGPSCRRVP